MDALLIAAAVFLIGLVGLVASSHYFVGGSAALAKQWGMRPGIIGLTIVAFGTSAPEIFVSSGAAFDGAPDLGIGNAVGSNIANIGMVLGLTALITRLPIDRKILHLEIPLLITATALAALFLYDHSLDFYEGIILMICALLLPVVLVLDFKRQQKPSDSTAIAQSETSDELIEQHIDEEIPNIPPLKAWIWFISGLLALLFSAEILVDAATSIAEFFGVSGLVIGLTVVAIGTSLPELAASLTSALKGHQDMAIGNIIGSNILNIFAVMSLPGLIMPTKLAPEIFSRDVLTMGLLTAIMVITIMYKALLHTPQGPDKTNSKAIGWPVGILFISIYLAYYGILFLSPS